MKLASISVLLFAAYFLPEVTAVCDDDGRVSVENGPSDSEGTAEVCKDTVFYQICDDGWSQNDAMVFCYQLGFSRYGAQAYGLSKYGSSGLPVDTISYQCDGTEDNLDSCSSTTGTTCDVDHAAGVKCGPVGACENAGYSSCCTIGLCSTSENGVTCYCDSACYGFGDCCSDTDRTCPQTCTENDIRVVDGYTENDGRVELCYNSQWTTVCNSDGSWNSSSTSVVCTQIGASSAVPITYTGPTEYGQGDAGITVASVKCSGSESTLTECSLQNSSLVDCGHQFDVGVDCNGECTDGEVIIVGGDSEGNVIYCDGGSWHYISDDGWGATQAKLICGDKGYSTTNIHAYGGTTYGSAPKAPTRSITCDEDDSSLSDCTISSITDGDTTQVASIQCNTATQCENAGHTSCCTFFCNAGGCYCDSSCYFFGDCCDGIEATCPSGGSCSTGELRIVNGTSEYEGTVELCLGGNFGPVCDNGWDSNEAKLVCSQLGYLTEGAVATTDSYFPKSTLPFVATDFNCFGSESTLSSCDYNNEPGCGHQNEAGVRCANPCNMTGSVRLVGGDDEYEGRVEICEDGVWRSICQGSEWSQEDAQVTCRQLGYSILAVQAYGDAHYGEGVGNISATDLRCTGSESNLYDCANTTENTCDHSTDVGVDCTGPLGPCQDAGYIECCSVGTCNAGGCYCDTPCHSFGDCCSDIAVTCPFDTGETCTNGEIRISAGDNANQGYVEFCVDNKWTSICDEGWDANEATVVCAEAGYTTKGAIPIEGGFFGQGGGPIEKGNFECTGTESNLASCSHSDSTCSQHKSAGVVCAEPCTEDGQVRLVGGDSSSSGYVEVCTGGTWGAICDENWCDKDAKVVCNQLGYSSERAEAYGISYFGQEVAAIQFTNVDCDGDESTITSCSNSTEITDDCYIQNLASVRCFPLGACETSGHTECCSSSCYVSSEDCYCDQSCHSFGDCCSNIDATCPFNAGCTTGTIRLVDGDDKFSGRLEMCVDETWGTVCNEDFDEIDAVKACAQLGLPNEDVDVLDGGYFGQGDDSILASQFNCKAGDKQFSDCSFEKENFCCGHQQDVAIRCNPTCTDGDIELGDGSTELEGTVKICVDGGFKTICDDGWSSQDASVVCRQLGYSSLGAQPFGHSFYNNRSQLIPAISNMQCSGSEITWSSCDFSEVATCDNTQYAGVRCDADIGTCEAAGFSSCCIFGCNAGGCYCDQGCHFFQDCCDDIQKLCPAGSNCTEGDTRLVNNNNIDDDFAGRVEICLDGHWGSICDDGWGLNEAHVVCKQLGYTSYGSVPAVGAQFGQSSFSIVGGNFECNGLEDTIHDCNYDVSPDCGHHEDASVYCNVPCNENDVRVVNGSSKYEGRVEFCNNGTWHPVCDEKWSNQDASVVCREIGYTGLDAQASGHSLYGNGVTPPLDYGFVCNGSETNLTYCKTVNASMCDAESTGGIACAGEIGICEGAGHTGCCISSCNVGGCYCDAFCHNYGDCCEGIDVTCPQTTCTDGDIRLVNGVSEFRGRVETCVDGQWGTVCDDGWDDYEARTVCNQIGYSTLGAAAKGGAYFGQNTNYDIVAGSFECTGSEDTLHDCTFVTSPDCGHQQDAGVICPERCDNELDLRLADGATEFEGRFEICLAGHWSSVCADDKFCDASTSVLCKQLGYSPINSEAYGLAFYGEGGGMVGIEGVNCLGTEPNITACQYVLGSGCTHLMDAGVKCKPISPCELIGHTSCCTSNCFNSEYFCWCDPSCHFFNDCCDNIEALCPSSTCASGETRLANGNDTAGVLEICYGHSWHTVCQLSFGDEEGEVACRAQGLSPTGFTIHPTEVFGQGEGPVFAKTTECKGNENGITDCSGEDDGCCSHSKDVGLTCQYACEDGDIRLVDGETTNEGRVEVCVSGRWGTVCDDLWDVDDARVACKMANLPWKGATVTAFAAYGSGIGPIHLDNLQCEGDENSLFDCEHITDHNCIHLEDAGVVCAPGPCELAGYNNTCCDHTSQDCQGQQDSAVCHCDRECEIIGDCCVDFDLSCKCTDYEIRLIDGSSNHEGRLEVCLNGEFGTVCDDFFERDDAAVACRQLGLPDTSVEVFPLSYFGQGVGPIQMDNVQCVGNETTIFNCSYIGPDSHNCIHFEDVGIRCNEPTCTDGMIRLSAGDHKYAGRLEVCVNGIWGTVCDDQFTNIDGSVACKSLSLPHENAYWFRSIFSFGLTTIPINMDDVQCTGEEDSIFDCDHTTDHNCNHFEDVALTCNPSCKYNGELRLVNGANEYSGRLEVCIDDTWGTVCDDGFDNSDAKVACRQLGLPSGSARSLLNLQYGAGYGLIQYSELQCTGNESQLIDCTKLLNGGFLCFHNEDVGIMCEASCDDGDIRLVNGEKDYEGMIEICRDGQWGSICDNSGSFGIHEARVACRQLNWPFTAAQVAYFSPGGDPIHYSNVQCDGSELSLGSCSKIVDSSLITCTHVQDIGVTCEEACKNGDVRLVDGTDQTNGRFEICLGGTWGTACDEEFHNIDAKIVCKQLGLEYEGAEAVFNGVFGYGEDDVAITQLHCLGEEDSILDCFYKTGSATSDCTHANDVGIICQDLCTNGDVRLADGTAQVGEIPPNSGRVEVCFNGEWGTVCENGWTEDDARVTCGQLGFSTQSQYVRTFGSYQFGPGIGEIYFASIDCTGKEKCLVGCPYSTDTSACTHENDAGIRCSGNFSFSELSVDEKCVTTCALSPPSQVSNVTLDINNVTTRVELRWDEPVTANGIITGYSFIVSNNQSLNRKISGNDAKYIYFDKLDTGIPYTFSLTASNLCGPGTAYTDTFFTGEQAPFPPKITSVTRLTGKSMTVQWEKLSLTNARGITTGYKVEWSPDVAPYVFESRTVSADSLMFNIENSNIQVNKPYRIRVSGVNSAGVGSYAEQIASTTDTVLVQVKLFLQQSQMCGVWLGDSTSKKITDLVAVISNQVASRCSCGFSSEFLVGAFECNPDEDGTVHFRGNLYSTSQDIAAANLASNIEDWLDTEPKVVVDAASFIVDPNCDVVITNSTDFCKTSSSSAATSTAAIGAGISVSLIVVLMFIGLIILVIVLVVRFRNPAKYGHTDASHEMVGFTNNIAFPEGGLDDNISQRAGSTIHDDDFQQAINMISDEVDQDMEKKQLEDLYDEPPEPKITFSGDN